MSFLFAEVLLLAEADVNDLAGGISCGIWTMACKRTIGTVKDIVVEAVGVREPVPVAVKVPVSATSEEASEKTSQKDEL